MKKGDKIRVIYGRHAGKTGEIISLGVTDVGTGLGDPGKASCVRFLSGESDWVANEFMEINTNARDPDADLSSPLQSQVGGDHYRKLAIQPVEFIHANKLNFLEGCIVKRICRHRNKNGRQDLEKIIHEVQLLIAIEYPEERK